jgi:hypothetical protein
VVVPVLRETLPEGKTQEEDHRGVVVLEMHPVVKTQEEIPWELVPLEEDSQKEVPILEKTIPTKEAQKGPPLEGVGILVVVILTMEAPLEGVWRPVVVTLTREAQKGLPLEGARILEAATLMVVILVEEVQKRVLGGAIPGWNFLEKVSLEARTFKGVVHEGVVREGAVCEEVVHEEVAHEEVAHEEVAREEVVCKGLMFEGKKRDD